MKIGTKVRIIDHEDYEVQRVGEQGVVQKVEERNEAGEEHKYVFVLFGADQEAAEYPFETVIEAEQKQVGSGGKDGLPDTSQPTPPQMDAKKMDDLEGKQDQVAQADSSESRPQAGSAQTDSVTPETIVLSGETPQLDGYPAGTGGTSSKERPEVGSSQSAGVKGEQVPLDGEQPQMDQVPGREKVKGVKDSAKAKPTRKVEGAFSPISIRVLDEADDADSYNEVGSGSSIRNEKHLFSSLRGVVRKALESMNQPFDAVDIVFRRNPKLESARRVAERKLIGTLHLIAEGKGEAKGLKVAASRAAKLGIRPSRFAEYATDAYSKKVLEQADSITESAWSKGVATPVWPASKLDKLVGIEVIVETVTNDVWKGTLEKAQVKEGQTGTKRMYQIQMQTGRKVFGANDIKRILGKRGVK